MCMVTKLLLPFPNALQVFPSLPLHQGQQQLGQLAVPLVSALHRAMVRQHLRHQFVNTLGAIPAGRVKSSCVQAACRQS